ncbi:MAG: hypothetical protein ABJ208_07430, partial [Rhodopirellula bahusiensis]
MKFNVLRAVAATLSMGVCTIASAQYGPGQYGGQPYAGPTSQLGVPQTQAVQTFGGGNYQQPNAGGYQAPAKWNNFGNQNNGPQLFQPASTGGYDNQLPPPESIPTPAPSYGEQLSAPVQQHVAPAQPAPSYSAPAPAGTVHQHSSHQHSAAPVQHYSAPVEYSSAPAPAGDCQSCAQPSPYMQAASQPWEGSSYAAQSCGMPLAAPVRAPLFPWFGSFDLLFFNMDTNGKDRNIVSRYD